ncbi:class I SAM-dependent DNA methyltransferase [Hufsiella ginkgonis]|uniref:Methyltransferase domain-containing protein n=1 Tax=Hufsiella ginkgonis TaxID=2695274 RepID=A0A7K1Y2I7_9SPHI|nr:class I SAM-dependent methyltransferase [Hufsiella ginkgonis]MXV17217.1 methyltransferase domain-containing protein [Hufsiella ginkgonis]
MHGKNVAEAYDVIAEWFSENRSKCLMEQPYLDLVIAATGGNGTVLDLGCGTGEPMMAYLFQQGISATGVDASQRMLEIAASKFPAAEFICQDMRNLSLNRKFGAVIAWHSFFHLSQEDQPGMFRIVKKHLAPNGIFLFTSGNEAGEVWAVNGGEHIFHASLDAGKYRELLTENGYELLLHVTDDPFCGGATVWMAKLKL